MTRVDSSVVLGTLGSDFLRVAAVDPHTDTAFFGSANNPGSVVRLDLSHFPSGWHRCPNAYHSRWQHLEPSGHHGATVARPVPGG